MNRAPAQNPHPANPLTRQHLAWVFDGLPVVLESAAPALAFCFAGGRPTEGIHVFFDRFIKGTHWDRFSEYLSPAFFDLVPPAELLKAVSALGRSTFDRSGYDQQIASLKLKLNTKGLTVTVGSDHTEGKLSDYFSFEEILRVYFFQIFYMEESFLDFRLQTWASSSNGQLFWSRANLRYRWKPEVLSNIRGLYLGFYQDDPEKFRASLANLGLEAAETELRTHFGLSQTSQEFKLSYFRESFHAVFVKLKATRQRVPVDFLPFGLSLATLYECLSHSPASLNVRKAFDSIL